MSDLDEQSPGRALVVALAAMAGATLLVGAAIAAVVFGVVRAGGLDESDAGGPRNAPESLFLPPYTPTESASPEVQLPDVSATASPSIDLPSGEATPRTDRITLFVAPQSVAPGERINLNGVYVDGEGVALQVQRKEGALWVDFPVTAIVRGGAFDTWIQTSRTGRTLLRVFDREANRASNAVTVQIG